MSLPIDNGIVERLHVRAALTRKNFSLPARTRAASARAAIAYTILGCCRLADVRRLSTDRYPAASPAVSGSATVPAMLPAAWKAARQAAAVATNPSPALGAQSERNVQ